ncbi:hypothetical protein U0070_011384 [Myodes glareolus]|uniref:Transmembrane protein PVRIG immunoglobulin-like domain-containing protein n=1 Tax=Myodes glareolus TaxID=447135 RepID=A0AAW0H345_MYOGA
MAQVQALVLFSSLLTLCDSKGSPVVWVQVQMEAPKLPSLSLSVRCGVLGTNVISLVTVRWETSNSVSLTLTLEQSKARNFLANTSFCCEFVTFPQGSRVACGDLNSSDPGLSAPAPGPILQGDLTRILGTLGVLLFGFIFILCLLWRQKRWCFSNSQPSSTSTQAQMQMQVRLEGRFLERGTSCPPQPASQASLAALPYPPPDSAPLCEAMVHHDQPLPRDTPLSPDDPYQPTNPHCLSPQLPCLASAHGSFISTENGLYALAGESLPHPIPDILASTDCLEYSTLCLGTQ